MINSDALSLSLSISPLNPNMKYRCGVHVFIYLHTLISSLQPRDHHLPRNSQDSIWILNTKKWYSKQVCTDPNLTNVRHTSSTFCICSMHVSLDLSLHKYGIIEFRGFDPGFALIAPRTIWLYFVTTKKGLQHLLYTLFRPSV